MKIVNLLHHPINILMPDGSIKTIEPSGTVARVDFSPVKIGEAEGVPIYEIAFSNIVGLPEPQENTIFVVSSTVKNAVGDKRKDVVALYGVTRIEGKPVYCRGFRTNG